MKLRPHVIHVQDLPRASLWLGLISCSLRIPIRLFCIQGLHRFFGIKGQVLKLLVWLGSLFYTHQIAVSKAVKTFWHNEYRIPEDKIDVIYNGVDLKLFNMESNVKTKVKLKEFPNNIIIATAGSLTPRKGHKYLIESVFRIVTEYPNARFVILGEGPLESKLKQMCERQQIQKFVHFMGNRADIADILKEIDIFVFPSIWVEQQAMGEGLPLALIEAMACGKPAVVSAVSGIVEVIEDGVSGYLVPPENSEMIAEKVLRLLDNPQRMRIFGLNAHQKIKEKFDMSLSIQEYTRIYRSKVNYFSLIDSCAKC